jgi:FkbM family methyltransferase
MHKIDCIYLTTYRPDSRLTRICLGSIRYFYPDLPIHLIVDESRGHVPESEFANAWGVTRRKGIPTQYRHVLSQLQVFTGQPGVRFFLMDADIVFAGRVLDVLEPHHEDIVVEREVLPQEEYYRHIIHLDRMAELDPTYHAPEWCFNSGQWMGTSGLITEEDWASWLTKEQVPELRYPETFYQGQGLLNYLVTKKLAEGKLSVGFENYSFWMGAGPELVGAFPLEEIKRREFKPLLLHWAGVKRKKVEQLPRADIMLFFERFYYSRINGGAGKLWFDVRKDTVENNFKAVKRRVALKTGRGYGFTDKLKLFLYTFIRKRPRAWELISRICGKGDWCVRVRTSRGPARLVFDPLVPDELSVVDELLYGGVYQFNGDAPNVLLDCRAFRGISTIYLQDQAGAATVEAYESHPDNFAVLQRRLAKHCPGSKAVHAAVGNSEGEVSFEGNGVGGRVQRDGLAASAERVRQIRLGEMPSLAAAKNLLLKLNVEGEEEQILPGLLRSLPSHCTVFLQTHGREKGAQDLVRPYRIAGFDVHMRRIRKDTDSHGHGSFIDWGLIRSG